jgi:hypothetical protein
VRAAPRSGDRLTLANGVRVTELIVPDDRASVLFEPTAEALAARLRSVLLDGLPLARGATKPAVNRAQWIGFHQFAHHYYKGAQTPSAGETTRPRSKLGASVISAANRFTGSPPAVTVCIVSRDRGPLLQQALTGLSTQVHAAVCSALLCCAAL